MSVLFKSTVLSLGLLAGVAIAAQAQTGSVAALPPQGAPAAAAPLAPMNPYPGPNPGSAAASTVQSQAAVAPSPTYVGPNPGLGYYGTPPRVPAGYNNQDAASHPYTTPGTGPRPN